MIWERVGFVLRPKDIGRKWAATHCQLPIAEHRDDDRIRIYFTTRDKQNRSRPTFIEVNRAKPREVLYVHDRPLLPLGKRGAFDDDGVMISSVVPCGDLHYMYYIGWSRRVGVPYHLAIGLAISENGGNTFKRVSDGPIIDRTASDPWICTAPCVVPDFNRKVWFMWYVAGTGWTKAGDPLYAIKHAHSQDGLNWVRTNRTVLEGPRGHVVGRPWVLARPQGRYEMWYSQRRDNNFRQDPSGGYRIMYAQSNNGLKWRPDKQPVLTHGHNYDADMQCYSSVIPSRREHTSIYYMFYNGNGFGRDGILLARSLKDETRASRRKTVRK